MHTNPHQDALARKNACRKGACRQAHKQCLQLMVRIIFQASGHHRTTRFDRQCEHINTITLAVMHTDNEDLPAERFHLLLGSMRQHLYRHRLHTPCRLVHLFKDTCMHHSLGALEQPDTEQSKMYLLKQDSCCETLHSCR